MKTGLFIIVLAVTLTACKKKEQPTCALCDGLSNLDNQYCFCHADTPKFDSLILGTWYLKQVNYRKGYYFCSRACYNDNKYTFSILSNNTIIRHLPDNSTDTMAFYFRVDSLGIDMTSGIYYELRDTARIPGYLPTKCGDIVYSSNYLSLGGFHYSTSEDNQAFPSSEYVLTRE